jgi:FkbM family methyltransferase
MVFSFEFIPSNIALMRKNIDMNPELKDRIDIIQNALWSESGMTLYCLDKGPGSNVKLEKTENHNLEVKTLSIDDFVKKHNLPKIDFIKMDIEGAELAALKGAEKTVRKHRPKLAISIYHNKNDFRDIPQYIRSLDLGYQYYLGHYTIHAAETVLYATSLSFYLQKLLYLCDFQSSPKSSPREGSLIFLKKAVF